LLIGAGGLAASGLAVWKWTNRSAPLDPLAFNDVHSLLNSGTVANVSSPESLEDLIGIVRRAKRTSETMSICGSRHAMGGQQFAQASHLIDTRSMNQVIDFDPERGLIDVECGIQWPALVEYLNRAQEGSREQWTIPMKQTGADNLTIGGALAANVHGRTLTKKPFIGDTESLLLVNADSEVLRCSRKDHSELFSLAIGGYGLFGVAHSMTMRLAKREKIERKVEVMSIRDLIKGFAERIDSGYTSGDFQFAIDDKASDFLKEGVFACYRPVDWDTPIPSDQKKVSERAWNELVYLAHTDKAKAFQLYADYYLQTSGQVYWSDTSQLGGYDDGYHKAFDKRVRAEHPGSEMITELYVPRHQLHTFMDSAAESLRKTRGSVIYGTIRLVKRDDESYLAWAKDDFACVIFNLHVDHTPEGIEKAKQSFRGLIDCALALSGSYYLTYHRWATQDQVERAYPQFRIFLSKKLEYDPEGRFQSEWYRHYRTMFA
jgi:FAD/FMN-containing dehydrogenase